MTSTNTRQSLSNHVAGAILIVLAIGFLSFLFVGHNAISIADTTAEEREERLAERHLADAIASVPVQQRSATIWDEGVIRTGMRDQQWMDENLGAWMQSYFGHNENYVLDPSDTPYFASIAAEVRSPDIYEARARVIAPLVTQLRAEMAEASEGVDDPFEEFAELSAVAALQFDDGVAIVSVVPIISDTGETAQALGTESLHVAVRYVDETLAQAIGEPIELSGVAFQTAPPARGQAGVPVTDPSGEAIAWMVWQPDRPGMDLLMRMLPILLASGAGIALLLWWVLYHLKRVSTQLAASEVRLQQAQRLEAVGQLSGGVAHDFNNLLMVIMGNIEMIQDTLEPDHPLRRYADQSFRAAESAAELTSRLLAFSRKQALQPQVTDVNGVIVGLEGMMHRTLSQGINIKTVAAEDLWRTRIDPRQLETTLLNLAINSRDAMPEGGTLTIETANVVLDETYVANENGLIAGEFVMIAVSDTGHGIPKDLINRVYEPFFTTKAVGKGTGLGLSMVYGFVKQTGGHISIYSEPGVGTTVRLYFPRLQGDDLAPVAKPGTRVLPQGRETILIVEDDIRILQHVAEQLSSLGYEVLPASTGASALATLRERQDIALLFTDVVLAGGMNGQQVAEEARKIDPDIKVLFTSGYAESAIVHNGRLDDGVELLSKPYRRAELAGKIRKVLDAKASEDAGR